MDMNIAYVCFSWAAILNFYDITWLLLLSRIDVLLYATIKQSFYVINIQNGCPQEI